mmetsp:Transcript_15221/g.18828  ORF Transcript_15221/g.18828 Transcript_15221/m.18828 type:complete len:405 (-) Transcript_15221:37-1251(-)|eukprot:CAMPEP_0204857364 /NCGR_PEP_ID=MMETSP1347-20130617/20629_1 /ASSEMBLY_ACC=CAM_ASM_000690 /TAXON_ID=215587 /ORGANISM="Aplanochytrium stocchinoi, Strain GSBS06" /LENGTH=404 /DNA_ID=CAMNT_0052004741 /DNA_START=48 /DNA_END=1262 /DNA_ORIENTATION=-
MSDVEEDHIEEEEVEVEVEEEEEEEKPQDLTESDVVTKYKLAADIANKTLTGLLAFIKPGKQVVSACAFGDSVIEKQCESVFKSKKIEKGIAFPTCISLNETVCHYSPLLSESVEFKEGDLVKVDFGVHIDGYIAVSAHSFICQAEPGKITGKAADLMLAAYTAAEAASKLIKPGNSNTAVTEAIEKTAACYGVKPCRGVLMHQMKRFVIDGNHVIIGREETDQKVESFEFEPFQVYTVDVFMSTGEGNPIQREARTTVFKRAVDQSYRLRMKASRYVFNEVNKRFPTLPFTIRALDEKQGRMGVVECVKHDLLHAYPVLAEKEGELVAHFKFTLLLLPSGTVKVTGLPFEREMYESDKIVSDELKAILALSSKNKKKKKKKKKKSADDSEAAADAAEPPAAPQ